MGLDGRKPKNGSRIDVSSQRKLVVTCQVSIFMLAFDQGMMNCSSTMTATGETEHINHSSQKLICQDI
jgi:hypothetical protein